MYRARWLLLFSARRKQAEESAREKVFTGLNLITMQQVTQFNLNLNVSLFLLSQLSFYISHEMRIFLSRVPSTSCTTCYLILSSFRIPLRHTSEIKTMMMMSLKGVEWNEGENSVIKSCTHKTFDLWFCNFVIHSRLPFPTTYLKRFSNFWARM